MLSVALIQMKIRSELQQTVAFAERDCLFVSVGKRREPPTDPAPSDPVLPTHVPKVNSAAEVEALRIILA